MAPAMTLTPPTQEMVDFFQRRTWEHIHRVRRCLDLLGQVTPHAEQLRLRAQVHDLSKFEEPERLGYIWVTEYYRHYRSGRPFEYPPGIQPIADAAKHHHYHNNRHHIEYHSSPADMNDVDLIELVCDWTAMAQEFDEPNASAFDWARRVLGSRWKFPIEREQFIMRTIGLLDEQLRRSNG